MSELQQEIEKIRTLIRDGQDFLVMGHRSVDGDAYGSSMALYFHLRNLGKNVEVVNELPITPLFHFLGIHTHITKDIKGKKFDAIFVCDCGELRLIGQYPEAYADIFEKTPVVNIDHHHRNSMFGTYNLVDTGSSSTCELVYDLIKDLIPEMNIETFEESEISWKTMEFVWKSSTGANRTTCTESEEHKIWMRNPRFAEISTQVATLLLFGIIRDTNCFKNSIRPHTFEVTSDLIALHAEYDKVIFYSYRSEKINYLQLYGHVLEHLVSLKGGKIVGGIVTKEILDRYGIPESELGPQLINEVLSSLEWADFAFLIKDADDNKKKLSFRARREGFDVSRIARHFGGGGHIQSAGAYTEASTEEILRTIEEMDIKI